MLEPTQDNEQIIERIAALDIGKAELVCCVRVPDVQAAGKRLQEVATYPTMTRSLLGMCDRLRHRGPGRRHVHAATQRSRRDGWFEVIAGKAMQANGNPTCFGFVQTYDTKPKRRLFEVLTAHGMAPNQQVTFLTDGGEDIRDLPRMLNPQAEHLLDWFHITMRITVMTNMA